MTKKIIISIISGMVLFAGAGCKKFLDVNSDPAGADKVDNNLLLSGVQITDAFNITGGYPAQIGVFWTQQLAYNQPAPTFDSYKVIAPDMENTWAYDLYPACLKNLKVLEAQATAAGNTHYEGIAKVMIAYNLAIATDLWNDVPYSEGFKGFDNLTPKYDSQESVYTSIFTLLDDGIKLMEGDDKSIVQPDAKDLIYGSKGGNQMDAWVKFAYLLKARYSLRLSYAPGKTATAQAQAALTAVASSFPDASYDAFIKFNSNAGSEAPWYQFIYYWGGGTLVYPASTFVDMLKKTNDPRIPIMFDPNDDDEYVGRVISSAPTPTTGNPISTVSANFADADKSVYFGTYDELLFIKAEATYLASGFAAAQPILAQAVSATMKRFGLDPTSAEVQDYITANCKLTAANAYEIIMNEKYISNFLSIEAYNDWRRTNFPKLTVVSSTYLGLTAIPRRLLYPSSENETNKQPQQPGSYTGRVWWDTKQ